MYRSHGAIGRAVAATASCPPRLGCALLLARSLKRPFQRLHLSAQPFLVLGEVKGVPEDAQPDDGISSKHVRHAGDLLRRCNYSCNYKGNTFAFNASTRWLRLST